MNEPESSGAHAQHDHEAWQDAAFGLARVTQAAALAAWPFRGRKQADEADAAAAHAIRAQLQRWGRNITVVSGEGEKDGVHHVAYGERYCETAAGNSKLALDPIDGTTRLSLGRPGALSAAALLPGSFGLDPGPSHYMQKIICPAQARGALDPEADAVTLARKVAKALGKPLGELCVFVLDKPRHHELTQSLLHAGARVACHSAGDLEGALLASQPGSGFDLLLGIGGTPEGMVAACGIRAIGGCGYVRLTPQRPDETERLRERGLYPSPFYAIEELVPGPSACAITGITPCTLVAGIEQRAQAAVTDTLLLWQPEAGQARVQRFHARD
jgi:fructose-1,6-bisphosphatase II